MWTHFFVRDKKSHVGVVIAGCCLLEFERSIFAPRFAWDSPPSNLNMIPRNILCGGCTGSLPRAKISCRRRIPSADEPYANSTTTIHNIIAAPQYPSPPNTIAPIQRYGGRLEQEARLLGLPALELPLNSVGCDCNTRPLRLRR